MRLYKNFFVLLLPLIFVFCLAWMMQSNMLLESDTSWLIQGAKNVLAGGSYLKNFFDPDPPLILYLNAPILFLINFLSLKVTVALRIYVCILVIISLCFCNPLINKLFNTQDENFKSLFLICIAIALLILPVHEFGQRDHFTSILTLPYFLLIACRWNKIAVRLLQALFIGIIAGLGFSIKPYFLIPFVIIELSYMIITKNFFAWCRPESIAVIMVVLGYFATIVLFHPDYLFIVMPYAVRRLYQAYNTSFDSVVFNTRTVFCYFVSLLCLILHKQNPYRALSAVFYLATIGYLIAYFIQQNNWFHHLLPAYCIAFLLAVVLMSVLAQSIRSNTRKYGAYYIALGIFVLIGPVVLPCWAYYCSAVMEKKNSVNGQVVKFVETHPQSFYFITNDYYPELERIESYAATRFPFLWMLRDFYDDGAPLKNDIKLEQDKQLLVELIADDLNLHKPAFVFVKKVMNIKLSFLLNYASFRQEWLNYHYLTTVGILDVYERI